MLDKLITDDFVGSGLDFAALEERGVVEAVSPAALLEVSATLDRTLGGVRFQYYHLDPSEESGVTPAPYNRYKVYWKELTGFAAHTKDPRPKYVQPPQTPNHLYIPPVTDWNTVLEDNAQSVVITEGEKKALALNLRGIPTVGVGGVSSIGNRKRGQLLIPELRDICAGNRSVLIAFDIDEGYTTMKPEVARAALILASQILELGGVPKIVTLPSDGAKKCAVDDWLKTHDLNGFGLYQELTKYAKPLDTATLLYAEAEKYVYIADSNALANTKTREAVLVADYKISSGNRQVVVQELVVRKVKGGGVETALELTARPLGDAFLKWGSRPTARATTYVPGLHHYLTSDGDFNQWKGWAQPAPDEVSAEDVAPLWSAFQAFYRDDALTMWNWFMYPIARPGVKWVMIPVIQGEEEGIGKSSIPAFFSKFIYGEGHGTPNNATTLNAMSLRDGRLEFMVRKQFLFLDDANDIHGNDVEALLKNLSTNDTVRANPKYLRSYECKNYANLCITTNRTLPFRLPETDRRLFFPFCSTDVLPSVWNELHKWGRNGGGGKVVAYAQQIFDADAIDPFMKAPRTDKKDEMIDTARSSLENFLRDLKSAAEAGGLGRVVLCGRELKMLAEHESVVKTQHDIGPATLSRALKMVGIRAYGRVRTEAHNDTFYIFADVESWKGATPAAVTQEYKDVPLDRIRIPRRTGKAEKVVPIKKPAKY
jgi:hypothetical protein